MVEMGIRNDVDSLSPFFLAEGSRLFQDSPISSNPTQEAVFMASQLIQEK